MTPKTICPKENRNGKKVRYGYIPKRTPIGNEP